MNEPHATVRKTSLFRFTAAGAACALLLVGCGNRVKGSASSTTVAPNSPTTVSAGNSAGEFGTMSTPCGPGSATGVTDVGLTNSTIKIGVITDTNAGPIRVPTAGIEPSMQAFVAYCNGLGGINGRKLDLKTYDSKLFNSQAAVQQACDDKLFALVGTGSVQDAPEAQPMIDCGLVDVAAYTATYTLSLSPNVVTPVPNPGDKYATGALKYIAKTYPEAIKKSAIFYTEVPASAQQGEKMIQAREKFGYTFIYTGKYPVIESDWATQIQTLKNKGVQYVTIVDTANAAVLMLQAMNDANYHPKVIDLGQQYYDPTVAESGVANGSLVLTNTQPFEEPNAAITEYVKLLKQASSTAQPTTLGVQGFSAGLLFATAAKSLGSHLTRTALLAKLHTIHAWDAGGLHPTQDPGANKVNNCTLYLKVQNNKFVREWPAKPSTDPNKGFDCDPKAVIGVHGNWGVIPHKKG